MTKKQFRDWCQINGCPACKRRMEYPDVYGVRLGTTLENICAKCYNDKWPYFPEKTKVKWGGNYALWEPPVDGVPIIEEIETDEDPEQDEEV